MAHKAFIEVNEQGTEAAAATGAALGIDSEIAELVPFTPIFNADRPFLYLIRDIESGTILFLGRMIDPTK